MADQPDPVARVGGRSGTIMTRAILLLLLVAALMVAPRAVFAQPMLVSAQPADGAVLQSAPKELVLTFDRAVRPLVLQLTDPYGDSVGLSVLARRGNSLVMAPPEAFGQGTYVLGWRAISNDGHPLGGSLAFSLDRPSICGAWPVTVAPDVFVRAAMFFTRMLIYVGLFFGVGGAFFLAWIASGWLPPRPAVTVIVATIAAALLAIPFSIGLSGLDALAVPLTALVWPAMWIAGFALPYGASACFAAAACLFGLLALQVKTQKLARALSAVALVAVGVALATGGHAATEPFRAVTTPAAFVHAAAIALWAGSLLPLYGVVRSQTCDVPLAKGSRAIPLLLPLLMVSGIVLAGVELVRPSDLWTTEYGVGLILKGVGLLGLLALVALNRLVLLPAFVSNGTTGSGRWLARSIGSEAVIVLMILAFVSLWGFTATPRALALAAKAPFFTHIHALDAMADVTVTPGNVGSVRTTIVLRHPRDELPLPSREVTMVWSNPAAGLEPMTRQAKQTDDGSWHVDDLSIPTAGRWQIRIDVLMMDLRTAALAASIEIKP